MPVEIDGVAIERVHENKFLGLTIDDRLSWKLHIKHVQSKVSRSIAVIHKAKLVLITIHLALFTVYWFCHIYMTVLRSGETLIKLHYSHLSFSGKEQ